MISIDQYHEAVQAAREARNDRKRRASNRWHLAARRARWEPVDMAEESRIQNSEIMAADLEYDQACRAAADACEV